MIRYPRELTPRRRVHEHVNVAVKRPLPNTWTVLDITEHEKLILGVENCDTNTANANGGFKSTTTAFVISGSN